MKTGRRLPAELREGSQNVAIQRQTPVSSGPALSLTVEIAAGHAVMICLEADRRL